MEKEVLEAALKSWQQESDVASVLSVKSESIGEFQNFVSTVTRLELKVVLNNGRFSTRRLIMKDSKPPNEMSEGFFGKREELFRAETLMYTAVLKEIEYLMEEFEDTDDRLWCNFIYHVPYKIIILEDLKAKGFKAPSDDGIKLLDLQHALLGVRSLAKFHGMAKVLEQRGAAPINSFKQWYIFNNIQMQTLMRFQLTAMANATKNIWDPKCQPFFEKLSTIVNSDLTEKWKNLGDVDETKFNCLNHGDCHKGNLLFRYDWDKLPIGMRFVDFQMVHYNSPCCDLSLMLYGATEPSVRRENYQQLVKAYHDTLKSTLDKYQYSGEFPSLQDFMADMERFSLYGHLTFIFCYPAVSNKDPQAMMKCVDFPKLFATGGMEGIDPEYYRSLEEPMFPDIEAFVNKFC